MKSTILALALLLCGSVAEAGPFGKVKNFVKQHPRFTTAAATLTLTSLVQWEGKNRCQLGDVERCNVGYGSRDAFAGFTIGAGVGMLAAAERCWKDQSGWKFCYALAYGVPAYQTYAGTHDFFNYKKELLGSH